MIFSVEQTFSDRQVVAATAPSDNIIDLGMTGTVLKGPAPLVRDIGKGQEIPVAIILTADAGSPADTLTVEVQVSEDEAFTTPVVVATSPQKTGGVAGDRVNITWVPWYTDLRYVRLNYTVTGSFTLMAGIVLANQSAEGVAGV